MEHFTVAVDDNTGEYTFLLSELSHGFIDETSKVQRASHIEPVSLVLRWVFYGLRGMFGEYGCMGEFTRLWPCLWRVNLSPVGGPILPTLYRNRKFAINAEVAWLEENFL